MLVSFFLYIFALVGMSSFAGKVRFTEEGGEPDPEGDYIPRENFDTLASSFVAIFEVLTYTWSDTMFGVIRCCGSGAAYYFIALVIMGSIVLMNLFLAIMLGNFDKARFYQMKKQIFKAFLELMHRKEGYQYDIVEACDLIFGDLSSYVKYRVLGFYSPEDRQREIEKQRKGAASVAKFFANDKAGQERLEKKRKQLEEEEAYKKRVAWFVRNARKNMLEVQLMKEK